MFERFTDDARAVVVRARQDALQGRAARVLPAHLLLGVAAAGGPGGRALHTAGATEDRLREQARALGAEAGSALDADALAALGIDLGRVRDAVEATFGTGALDAERPPGGRTGHVRFGAASRKALEHSLRAALRLGDRRIDTAHLLLGVLAVEDPQVTAVLRRLGVDTADLRRRAEERSDAA